MLKWITIVACIFAPSFLRAVTTPIPIASEQSLKLSYSDSDYKIGKTLGDILGQMRRQKLQVKSTQDLLSLAGETKVFKAYIPIFNRLNQIATFGKEVMSFHKVCPAEKVIPENKSLRSLIHIYKKVDRHCRYLFLNNFIESKDEISFSSDDLKFLSYASPFYLKRENSKYFKDFIEKIPQKSKGMEQLLEIVLQSYKTHKLQPESSILALLPINQKLTQYVQNSGLNEREAIRYFSKEFSTLYRQFSSKFEQQKFDEAFQKAQNVVSFYKANKELIPQKKAWGLIISSGKKFLTKGKRDKAQTLFQESYDIAKGDQKFESVFHLMWTHITNKNYKESIKVIEKYSLIEDFSKYNSKVQFWVAKTLKESGETFLAKHLYKRLLTKSPLSFYAIIASKELEEMTDKKVSSIPSQGRMPSSAIDIPQDHYTDEFLNSLTRLLIWLKASENRLSFIEMDQVSNMKKNEVFNELSLSTNLTQMEHRRHITIQVIDLLQKQDKYLHAFKLVHTSLDKKLLNIDNKILSYLFPFPYHSNIKKIDRTIDPLLVLSLIRQESAFNPYARSSVGARGLMQLMPATARSFKKGLKSHHLKRPTLNLKIGIKYFKRLLKKYDGNLVYTLAAYNAGQGKVARWKRKIFKTEDPLVLIESIPYSETRKYVKLIYRNMHFYRMLAEEETEVSLKDSFTITMNSRR